jgi:hypothetical protein
MAVGSASPLREYASLPAAEIDPDEPSPVAACDDPAHFPSYRNFLPFDLAMFDIGAWDPLWADIHMGPEGVVRSFRALGGHGLLMPIQLGTLRSSPAPRHDVPSLKTNAQRARKLYEANESLVIEASVLNKKRTPALVLEVDRLPRPRRPWYWSR